MGKGTPNEGVALIGRRVFILGDPYSLVAYTNAQDSLTDTSVFADLVQPSQTNGYAPILLSASGWDTTNGVCVYTHPPGPTNDGFNRPCWFATGAWSGTVTGVALIYAGVLQHYADLLDGGGFLTTFVAAAGKGLAVNIQDMLG